ATPRPRRRGRTLGPAHAPRPARVLGRLLERGPDPARLPRPAGAPRDPPRVGGAAGGAEPAGPRPLARGGRARARRLARRRPPRRAVTSADRRDGRGKPALPRAARGGPGRGRAGDAAA